jgi:hypothetical protein
MRSVISNYRFADRVSINKVENLFASSTCFFYSESLNNKSFFYIIRVTKMGDIIAGCFVRICY